jgi:hypothetical protein
MNLTPRRVLNLLVICTGFLAVLLVSGSESFAHPRHWRHAHRRRVIVVGRPAVVKNVVMINGQPYGTIDFSVDPSTTEVYVDDKMRGTVDDFDGSPQKLHLRPGAHVITLKTPEGEKVSRTIDIQAGTEINLKLDLDSRNGTN